MSFNDNGAFAVKYLLPAVVENTRQHFLYSEVLGNHRTGQLCCLESKSFQPHIWIVLCLYGLELDLHIKWQKICNFHKFICLILFLCSSSYYALPELAGSVWWKSWLLFCAFSEPSMKQVLKKPILPLQLKHLQSN